MNQKALVGLRVAILATDGFEQSELLDPRAALESAGAAADIISLKSGSIRGWKDKAWSQEIAVDETVDRVDAKDYDALLLPGGVMNPDALRMEPKAVAFVKAFFDAAKPVAAICHGPWTIIEAGVSKGRQMTSWSSLKSDIVNSGGHWLDQEVVVDKNLVTSRKPDDIPAFNRAFVDLLTSVQKTADA